MEYATSSKNSHQSSCFSLTNFESRTFKVWFVLSSRPFVWGWYALVTDLFIPSCLHMASFTFATNSLPWSDNNLAGAPHLRQNNDDCKKVNALSHCTLLLTNYFITTYTLPITFSLSSSEFTLLYLTSPNLQHITWNSPQSPSSPSYVSPQLSCLIVFVIK